MAEGSVFPVKETKTPTNKVAGGITSPTDYAVDEKEAPNIKVGTLEKVFKNNTYVVYIFQKLTEDILNVIKNLKNKIPKVTFLYKWIASCLKFIFKIFNFLHFNYQEIITTINTEIQKTTDSEISSGSYQLNKINSICYC